MPEAATHPNSMTTQTMKNTLKALTLAAMAAPASVFALEGLEVDSYFAFESEYSFRGVKLAGPSIQPGVDISYMGAYVGVWSSSELFKDVDGPELEIDYLVGYAFEVEDFEIDLGFTAYTFPGDTDTYEAYIGVTYGAIDFEPSLYFFYDFELEAFTIEGGVGYGFDLAELGLEGFGLDFGGSIGYVFADDSDEDYFYYLLTADLVFDLNDAAYASVGVRLSGNDGDVDPDTQLWWGAAIGVAF